MREIRRARPEDAPRLAELSEELGYKTDSQAVLRRFMSIGNNPDYSVYVAVEEFVVGFISFEKYETLFLDPGLNITALVVERRSQNKGIGKQLVQKAEEVAREHHYSYLRANSGSQRTEAHDFYRRLGFDSEKEQKRFIKNLGPARR